jgi:hypothetical protein
MVKKLIAPLGLMAFAQYAFAQGISLPNPLSAQSFTAVANDVTGFLFTIAVPLTAIMAIIGGFQMITAAGDPEKFSSGRKTLMYAVIGFAIVVLAGGIVSIIEHIL